MVSLPLNSGLSFFPAVLWFLVSGPYICNPGLHGFYDSWRYCKWNLLKNCILQLFYKTKTEFYICFYSVTLLNSFSSSSRFSPNSLGFSTYMIMSSVNKEFQSVFSFCALFISLSGHFAPWGILVQCHTWVMRVESLAWLLIFGGTWLIILPLGVMMLSRRFLICALCQTHEISISPFVRGTFFKFTRVFFFKSGMDVEGILNAFSVI